MISNRSEALVVAGIAGISLYWIYKLFYHHYLPEKTRSTTPPNEILDHSEDKIEMVPNREPPSFDAKIFDAKLANISGLLFFPTVTELPSNALVSRLRSDLIPASEIWIETKEPLIPTNTIMDQKPTTLENKLAEPMSPVPTEYKARPPLIDLPGPVSPVIPAIQPPVPEYKAIPATVTRESKDIDDDDKLIEYIICPILGVVMTDPVSTALGQTYERSAIEEWFGRGKLTDPISNQPLSSTALTPNFLVKSIIAEYRQHHLHFIPTDNRITKQQLADDIKKTITILSSLQDYANKSGIHALTKHHQPEARQLLVELRIELGILKRCKESDKNKQIQKIIDLLERNKTPNKKSGYTRALQQVIEEMQKHYPITTPVAIRHTMSRS